MEKIKILGDWTRLPFKNPSGPKNLKYAISRGGRLFFSLPKESQFRNSQLRADFKMLGHCVSVIGYICISS